MEKETMNCPDCEKRIERHLELDLKNFSLVMALIKIQKRYHNEAGLSRYISKVIEKNNLNKEGSGNGKG